MRKILALTLSVLMLLSALTFAIPASAAPEGTAISTAEDFMNMAAEGKYYLAADITIAATYPNAFKGTFDGNGKTVTVSAPMFNDFSGEVKNLTIAGNIVIENSDVAAFAINSADGINFTDCTNNVNITASGSYKNAAGFLAYAEKLDAPCVFTNVVNNGNIDCTYTNDAYHAVGGLGGRVNSVIAINCTNNGNLYALGECTYMAGLVAIPAFTAGANTAEAYNCVNNGKLSSLDTYIIPETGAASNGGCEAGGMFCEVGCSGNAAWYRVWGCVNNGTIESTGWTAGMVGYTYGSQATAYMDIQFCINAGDIIYGRTSKKEGAGDPNDWASPFIAYTNSPFTTIKYNIDIGKMIHREGAISATPCTFVGLSSADATQYDIKHNYTLNFEQFEYYSYAASEDNAGNRHKIDETDGILPVTLQDIASGKIAHIINEEAPKDEYGFATFEDDSAINPGLSYAFYQKLGAENLPKASVTEIAGEWVLLEGSTYKNGDKPADVADTTPEATTEAPKADDTTAPAADDTTAAPEAADTTAAPETPDTTAPEAEKTGCGAAISGVVAIVAILGTALIIKKRD